MHRDGGARWSFAGWVRCPLAPPGEGGRFDGGRSGEPTSIIGTVGETADMRSVKSSQSPLPHVLRRSRDIHNLRNESDAPAPRRAPRLASRPAATSLRGRRSRGVGAMPRGLSPPPQRVSAALRSAPHRSRRRLWRQNERLERDSLEPVGQSFVESDPTDYCPRARCVL